MVTWLQRHFLSAALVCSVGCQSSLLTDKNETSHQTLAESEMSEPQKQLVFKLRAHEETALLERDSRLEKAVSLRGERVRRIQVPAQEAEAILQNLNKDPGIEWAVSDNELPMAQAASETQSFPNDPLFESQTHLSIIRAVEAWNTYTKGSENVKVVVCDTGISVNHEDLKDNTRADMCLDTVLNSGGMCPITSAHGTQVAGIIAATADNGVGVAGVTWKAQLIPVQVASRVAVDELGRETAYASESSIADCIEYAIQTGAQLVNISFETMVGGNLSPYLREAAARAESYGVLVVAAAGNTQQTVYENPSSILYVGSTTEDGRATFSSTFGPHVDLSAPGENVNTTHTTLDCVDSNANHSRDPGECTVVSDSYLGKGTHGTSYAAAQVTGAAALLKARFPKANVQELQCALTRTADERGLPGRDLVFGHGLLQVDLALEKLGAAERGTRPVLGISNRFFTVKSNELFNIGAYAFDAEEGNVSDQVVWRLPDNSTFTGPVLSTRLFKAGEYNVVVTAFDSTCSATTQEITIVVTNTVPELSLLNPSTPTVTLELNEAFTATARAFDTEQGDLSDRILWDFGNLSFQVGRSIEVKFASAGLYPVELSITDAGGLKATKRFTIEVKMAAMPPAAPIDLRVGSYNLQRAELAWKDVSNNESGFIIERAVVTQPWGFIKPFQEIARVNANTEQYVDYSVRTGSYAYRVTAYNSHGMSAGSPIHTIVR